MHGVTHGTVGLTAGALAATALHLDAASGIVLAGSLGVGSLIPDGDQDGALIWKRSRLERQFMLLGAAGAIARMPLLPMRLLPHRGKISHSPFTLALLIAASMTWTALYAQSVYVTLFAVGIATGYQLHLAGDGCTPMGVPGWPFWERIWLLPEAWRIPVGETVRDRHGQPVKIMVRDRRTGRMLEQIKRRRWSRREVAFLCCWLLGCGLVFIAL